MSDLKEIPSVFSPAAYLHHPIHVSLHVDMFEESVDFFRVILATIGREVGGNTFFAQTQLLFSVTQTEQRFFDEGPQFLHRRGIIRPCLGRLDNGLKRIFF